MEVLLEEGRLSLLVPRGLVQRVADHPAKLLDQPVGLLDERHPAEDDLRRRHLRAVVGGDRRDDDEHPVGRQGAAVAKRDVVGIADVDPVDEDHPGADLPPEPRP